MWEFLDWLDAAPLPFSLEGFLVAVCLSTMWFVAEAAFKPAHPSIQLPAQVVFLSSIVLLLLNAWLWMAQS